MLGQAEPTNGDACWVPTISVSQMSWGVLQGGGEGAILAKKRQRESEEKNNAVSFFLTLYVRLFYSLCARFSVFDAEGPFDVGRFCVCQNFPHFARFFFLFFLFVCI